MAEHLQLGLWQMLAAYIFVVILLVIVRIKGISREKEIIIASLRMTLQLIIAGYVLQFLLENSRPLYTVITILVMEAFSIYNIQKRVKRELSPELKKVIAISMFCGTLSALLFFLFVVIQIDPWYDPATFIPIAGMLIGNAMTGISLAVNGLVDSMHLQKDLIEASLMLGAKPKVACKDIIDKSFDSAILPTLNSMLGMGIVFLPGMMTGQILSGVSPHMATRYQIVIMLGILGSVSLTVFLFVEFAYKTFFNEKSQIIISRDK